MFEKSILVAITGLTVHYLPKILRIKPRIPVKGTVAPGFEEIMTVFGENFTHGLEKREGGSAFAAYHRGKKVAHVYGGYADPECHQVWNEDTLSIVFSVTKAVAAICIAVLVDRGVLEYDSPVAHYWPEFAANGKKDITVQQLMEHKAGLAIAPQAFTYKLLGDVQRCGAMLAAAPPLWEISDCRHGYHAVSYGPLVGELLRRVDHEGRTLGRFFAEEIAKPFGIDFFIGLPLTENHRVAKLSIPNPGPTLGVKAMKSSRNRQALGGGLRDRTYLKDIILNLGDLLDMTKQNNPEFRALEIPSVNGFGTADGLAKLMGILSVGGSDLETGKTLLSRDLVNSFMDSDPETVDLIVKIPVAWRRGMLIDYTEDGRKIFGHPGAGGPTAYADPHHQLGYAFTTRCAGPFGLGDDPRFVNLQRAMYRCVKRLEAS